MYTIVTDTSANLPSPLLRERGILVLPFVYRCEGKEHTCLDTEAFDGHAFYQSIRDGAQVDTSQINPETFAGLFRKELAEGRDVLFVSMSSGISGSCQSARIAASELREEFPLRRVEVIDTMGASLGEGIIALLAAELRDAGVELDEALPILLDRCRRMCQVFTVDDLMHLRRTGRVSNFTAIVGTVLNIKPLLKGDETGHIVTFGKLRGRRKAVEALAEIYNARVQEPEQQIVGIAHADCPRDAERLIALLREKKPPREILNVVYEPVTGSHVGPDTLALFFLSDEDCRSVQWPLAARHGMELDGLKSVPTRLADGVKNAAGGIKNAAENLKSSVASTKLAGDVKNAAGGLKNAAENLKNAVASSRLAGEVKSAAEGLRKRAGQTQNEETTPEKAPAAPDATEGKEEGNDCE